MATVYCIVPVHNRLAKTKRFVELMQHQTYREVVTVIVDDGSIDGTQEFLKDVSGPQLVALRGSGDLWWGGGVNLGLKYVFGVAVEGDYLLMLNDDVRIADSYVADIVNESRERNGAIIGSVQSDEISGRLMSSAYRIDHWMMRLPVIPLAQKEVAPDALPARGLLIPIAVARSAGYIHKWFPHYLGDLDYTARIRDMGYELRISNVTVVATMVRTDEGEYEGWARLRSLLGRRSTNNAFHTVKFFMLHGGPLLRVLAVPRFLVVSVLKVLLRR